MKEDNLEDLFAAVRRAGKEESPSVPAGFAESVLRRHNRRVQENRAFLRTSILSIATAFLILGTILGINFHSNEASGFEDQESTVEMAYTLWDPVGN
jgi:hypothetical protein